LFSFEKIDWQSKVLNHDTFNFFIFLICGFPMHITGFVKLIGWFNHNLIGWPRLALYNMIGQRAKQITGNAIE
jgi:hypothetical protein